MAADEAIKAAPDDLFIKPFHLDTFDVADYINAALPALATTAAAAAKDGSSSTSLRELSASTQSLLASLNAQTSRLSNSLTQLTDEIIRSGSRLAYEVEILRGETTGLSDVLLDKLNDDIALFPAAPELSNADDAATNDSSQPDQVKQLRMLTHVRTRLDSVIKVFGEAMQWPVPPSEMSSSLISVTAPSMTPEEATKREERAKQVAQKLRDEVTGPLNGSETPEAGIAAANQRINDLRQLALVWKGTAEDKYRNKFIDGLAKLVEDEQKRLAARSEGRRTTTIPSEQRTSSGSRVTSEATYGFMNSFRKIRGDM